MSTLRIPSSQLLLGIPRRERGAVTRESGSLTASVDIQVLTSIERRALWLATRVVRDRRRTRGTGSEAPAKAEACSDFLRASHGLGAWVYAEIRKMFRARAAPTLSTPS